MESKMLSWLREYVAKTPAAEVKKYWDSIKSHNFEGPNAFDYLDFIQENYCYDPPSNHYQLNDKEYTTPIFSESFFCVALQYE